MTKQKRVRGRREGGKRYEGGEAKRVRRAREEWRGFGAGAVRDGLFGISREIANFAILRVACRKEGVR